MRLCDICEMEIKPHHFYASYGGRQFHCKCWARDPQSTPNKEAMNKVEKNKLREKLMADNKIIV